MQYLTTYSAPPPRSAFKPADMARLVEIREEIQGAEKSALQTEWSQAAHACDQHGVNRAITLCRAALPVLVAQDDDGYYFAIPDLIDEISVRHDAAANTIDLRCEIPVDGEQVDLAVRQEFAGNHDLIRAWEQACEAGYGPDGPVGIDGWMSVRLPD